MVSSLRIYQLHILGLQFVHDDQGVLKKIINEVIEHFEMLMSLSGTGLPGMERIHPGPREEL